MKPKSSSSPSDASETHPQNDWRASETRMVEFFSIDPQEPEGWNLVPEGAMVHRQLGTAVISDVHLGYEWARGSAGDMVPAHSLAETLKRLTLLTQRFPIQKLVVAGDLVESASACARTWQDVSSLVRWLTERSIELVHIHGNHEGHEPTHLPLQIELGGWGIAHGHRPLRAGRWIIGHHHPALRVEEISAPCFLVHPQWIVLPAFSSNAAGLDVIGRGLPGNLRELDFQCIVPAEGQLLDFGNLVALRARLRPLPAS